MNISQSALHIVLGLDVGDRRIGVAMASVEAGIASPLITLDRTQVSDIYNHILHMITEQKAGEVIIGLPRGMQGQETAQTTSAREFAAKLQKVLNDSSSNCKVYMQDEAATSIMAEEDLKAAGKPYVKGDIDKQAATYILNDWLANRKRSLSQ